MVDTHEADTRGGQGLEARPSALKADKRGRSGIKADNGGHMADKLRGCGQSISRPAFFLLRENPTVNCLGKKKRKTGTVLPWLKFFLHKANERVS